MSQRLLNRILVAFALVALLSTSASAQELLLRGSTDRNQSEETHSEAPEAKLPPMAYTHPTISSDGNWGGLMTGLIIAFFVMAMLVGVLTDIDRKFDAQFTATPESAADASGGHAHH